MISDDFSDLLDLKMDDLEKLLDLSDLADDLVSELLQKLRDSYKEIVSTIRNNKITQHTNSKLRTVYI